MQRFETKYDLLNAAYKDESLKKGTVALIQYLVYKSNKEQCFPAVETIAKAIGCCKRTVQYNMRKLEQKGYIIRKDRWYNHQQLSNQYVFNLGVTEDMQGKMKYSDEEYDTLNSFSFNNPSELVCKIKEIKKIYEMKLSANEKLLLIYLCHRANKKGIAYDTPEAFMEALGMRSGALRRALMNLRSKGVLKIKFTVVGKKEYLIMKLTGKDCNVQEEIIENSQEDVSDQKIDYENDVQDAQFVWPEIFRNRKWKRSSFVRNLFSNMKKYFRRIHRLWNEMREILRL